MLLDPHTIEPRRPQVRRRSLTHRLARVVSADFITATVREVTLQWSEPVPQASPGDKVWLRVEGRTRRAYTLSRFQPEQGRARIVGVLHDRGPGGRWFSRAGVGQSIEVAGPQPDVSPRVRREGTVVLLGDETAYGLFAGMATLASRDATVIGAVEQRTTDTAGPTRLGLSIDPVERDDARPGAALRSWLERTAHIPHDADYVICGHARAVRLLTAELTARGVRPGHMRARVYWS